MRFPIAAALLLAWLPVGAGAQSIDPSPGEPSRLAPYRYAPPPERLTPAERGIAESYRNDLRRGVDSLQFQSDSGAADILQQRSLQDSRSELHRMDRLLGR
ncbi:MAG: hypothetical protein GC191_16130 [Azospirillum sp.]|nr:hypothetical protein [Azospirillum sp.]